MLTVKIHCNILNRGERDKEHKQEHIVLSVSSLSLVNALLIGYKHIMDSPINRISCR